MIQKVKNGVSIATLGVTIQGLAWIWISNVYGAQSIDGRFVISLSIDGRLVVALAISWMVILAALRYAMHVLNRMQERNRSPSERRRHLTINPS